MEKDETDPLTGNQERHRQTRNFIYRSTVKIRSKCDWVGSVDFGTAPVQWLRDEIVYRSLTGTGKETSY